MATIAEIRIRPIRLPLQRPYHWAHGTRTDFAVNLVEAVADDGTVGVGECTVAPDQRATQRVLERLARHFVGESPHDVAALAERAFAVDYLGWGAATPRAANQVLAGIEMALQDLRGRLTGLPVHRLLGGARRAAVGYFHFLQGATADELAADAAEAAARGERVFYLKVGRGDDLDIAITRAVREQIGDARLRLDANEAWEPARAIRMCRRLAPFDIEFIEQPVPGWSLDALAQVRASVPMPVVADQAVFTLHDVHAVCERRAADLICLGVREIGGIGPLVEAAAVARAAGLSICIHGSFTTGITACAEHQAALAIPNLDDGNQIMCQLLATDVVAEPSLRPDGGWMPALTGPGLGCRLDRAAIDGAEVASRDD